MTILSSKVLSRLLFHYPSPVIGAVLADQFGCSGEKIREAIHELRCVNDKGKRYLIIGDGDGYRLSRDIEEGRKYKAALHARAMAILEAEKGVGDAIQYELDRQGITGTLFERVSP